MTEKITSFTQLRTWQEARKFAVATYKMTDVFPVAEKFGLVAQLRRAAVSVAANIAEGFSRNTANDKVHFYAMALGSLTEVLSHTYIAADLGFVDPEKVEYIAGQVGELHKMINGMMKSARGRNT